MIQFPAELQSFKTYATKLSVAIVFETQEALNPNDLAQLLSSKGKTGWLLFKPTEQVIDVSEIPDEPVREKHQKSQSQRLRNVQYRYWELVLNKVGDFNTWQTNEMERLIDVYKEKLPEV
jgi:hypothetical protein